MKWSTYHEKPQEGWNVDFDFFEPTEDDGDDGHGDARYEASDSGSVGIFNAETGEAMCFVVSVPYDSARMTRNANLAAAAPEMESALRGLLDTFNRCEAGFAPTAELRFAARDAAVAALSKAATGS